MFQPTIGQNPLSVTKVFCRCSLKEPNTYMFRNFKTVITYAVAF